MVQGQLHFCEEHKTRFFKNEKADLNGQIRVWYSHKKSDGSGFCVEDRKNIQEIAEPISHSSQVKMLMCNAMNNAVALAASGRIEINQIGSYYKKILGEFNHSI